MNHCPFVPLYARISPGSEETKETNYPRVCKIIRELLFKLMMVITKAQLDGGHYKLLVKLNDQVVLSNVI